MMYQRRDSRLRYVHSIIDIMKMDIVQFELHSIFFCFSNLIPILLMPVE